MKRLLFFSILSIFCLTISAQTKTWIGPSGGSFGDSNNWNPVGVPGQNNDVIFPTGSNLIMNIPPDIQSFELQGNAMVSLPNNISFTQASIIGPNATFVWSEGIMIGDGTLTNNGTLNITGNIGKSLGNTHVLINNGTINNDDTGSLSLGFGSPTLNNTASGVINLNSNSSITIQQGVGTLINSGLIRKQQSSGVFNINANFQNNNGTISVESGTLLLNNGNSILTDGTYNVTTGSILEWAFGFTTLGTLTGQVDGQINWTGNMNVDTGTEAILNFSNPTGLNWMTGNFGGNGTLTNTGILNIVGNIGKAVAGQSNLNNEGTINFNGTGSLSLGFGTPTFTNSVSGVLNLNSDTSITGQQGIGTLINTGLIRRQQSSGIFNIDANFQNNNGIISVESGTLLLNNGNSILTDGTYNVTSGSTLEWAFGFTTLGTLTGQLDGQINWTGNMNVDTGTEAILNFSNPTGMNWTSGGLGGNGTLTNMGILNLVSINPKSIGGTTDLNNEGVINFNGLGALILGFGSPTLSNSTSGIINLNSDSSFTIQSGSGTVINQGLISKQSTGTFNFTTITNNMSPGIIICENGLTSFDNYVGNGTITGNGSLQMPANPIFEGTISPGGFPGTLTYVGNYASSANTIMLSEIYGPNAGTEYDIFDVQGNAIMDGNIVVAVYNEINLGDEFVIVTANSITSCNLPATVSANNEGTRYTFDVICNPDNVTLKVNNILLGTDQNSLSNLVLYPNPSNGQFTIDLGREYTDVNVQVYNMLGQQISSEKFASAKTIAQEINASAGIYFVKVSTAKEGSNTLRIIKQ